MSTRSGRTATAVALLVVAVALGPTPPAGAVQGIAPASSLPRNATALRPTADVTPPGPPPPSTDPPAGIRPGSAPGLRRPETCTPPAPDEPAAGAADMGAERMQLTAAHRLAMGSGQVVAVIDTGVHADPRFGSRLRGGGDYLTGGNGLDDCDGHGTAVAGILASGPEPGRTAGGFVGIAPDAQVLAIRQSSPSFEVPGAGGTLRKAGDVETLADAIVLAVREGAGVVNISEAVCLPARQAGQQGASIQAALHYAVRSDVVVVAAAGNAGVGSCAQAGQDAADQVSLPGWYGDDILAVGAVGPDDEPASFTVPGSWVDIAAPGTGLRSLAVAGGTTGTGVEGTSFAAPWVSGLAALVRERYPELTAAQVTARILATARRSPGGRSDAVGYGVVDPVAALTVVPEVLAPAAPGAPTRTAELPMGEPAGPAPNPGVDLLAASALIGAGTTTVWLLRRRPTGRRQPGRIPV